VIVMVPEIALTPQIVARFAARFGDTVAVLHSRMTPGQRYEQWRRLREGEARVCVGPRSAVFAPVAALGLIVIDEEHDASYKHEGDPRYDAREVAAERAARAGALLLAGSATPRPESIERMPMLTLARRMLAEFEAAPCGVLIGTQMVAKGHDFPDVSLGVVLDADATLRFPDFRADERTFALISQLAGRAGRGGEGRVLVQTLAPEARAIRHAAKHDTSAFAAEELERRRALGYPPFTQLIRIVLSAEQAAPAREAALEVRERLQRALGEGSGTLLGPAPLFRLRGRERQVIVIKAPERRRAVAAAGEAVAAIASERRHAGVSFSVDVDPQ
jgi:primosomal protein N'